MSEEERSKEMNFKELSKFESERKLKHVWIGVGKSNLKSDKLLAQREKISF
jgi:hypothetical protein